MAFYSQGKKFLNLPEQVQKNLENIADLTTKEADDATDIATNKTDIDSLKTRVSTVETNTTSADGAITTGTLKVEKTAEFGSDVEVDGGLTLNQPSDLHFKTGDSEYTDFQSFLTRYNEEAYQFLFSNLNLYKYEEGANFNPSVSFPHFKEATSLEGCFQNATCETSVELPAMTATRCSLYYAFVYFHGTEVILDGGNFILWNAFTNSDIQKLTVNGTVSSSSSSSGSFSGCTALTEVGAIDMSNSSNCNSIFFKCTSLKAVHCTHWRISFDISASTAFEQSDLMEIIGNLDSVTTAQTLTMGATNLAKLTSDQILVATGKGWTLA